jgi:hypothetical protein
MGALCNIQVSRSKLTEKIQHPKVRMTIRDQIRLLLKALDFRTTQELAFAPLVRVPKGVRELANQGSRGLSSHHHSRTIRRASLNLFKAF